MPHTKKVREPINKNPLHRASLMFKVWSDERKQYNIKLIQDGLTSQRVLETLFYEYINDGLDVKELIHRKLLDGTPVNRQIENGLEHDETSKLFDELERLSPLQDKEVYSKK